MVVVVVNGVSLSMTLRRNGDDDEGDDDDGASVLKDEKKLAHG